MPELPEVETVRRGLAPLLESRRIATAVARRADLRWPLPERFAERIAGSLVERVERRGKYLLIGFEAGTTLLAHLGMSGRLLVLRDESATRPPAPGPHDHVEFTLASAAGEEAVRIVFRDPRRFGAMDLLETAVRDSHPLLRNLGPEPLDSGFTAAYLRKRLSGRTAPVKTLLIDQRTICGMGNIYASESLHDAGIAPLRRGGQISAARVSHLAESIRSVFRAAIRAGGSTLRDFRGAEGELGYFQHRFAVYGRAGQPCSREDCDGFIRMRALGGRATYWCPVCQR